jgi:hypothetical protein
MNSEQIHSLEERIKRSENHVLASDTLRGRIVGEVLQRDQAASLANRLSRFSVLLLICNACVLMSIRSLDRWWHDHYQPLFSLELVRRADEIQQGSRLEPTESLAMAYGQWKSKLASHWEKDFHQGTVEGPIEGPIEGTVDRTE